METIRSLQRENTDGLYKVFQKAFKDYEMQLTNNQLNNMLRRRGFVPELSFGAYIKDELVAFTFNGIGMYRGAKTAYDTGTGTVEDYRGKGLATRIFNYSIPFLKEAGVECYLLEVLQHNSKAVSVYKKIGFEVSREFNYFIGENFRMKKQDSNMNYHLKPIDLNMDMSIRSFWDFEPSWQNSFESIGRKAENFLSFGAFAGDKIIAYCIVEYGSGDIAQVAVDRSHRRKGVATALLRAVFKNDQHSIVKCINTDVSCDSITGFLTAIGLPLAGKQYEMKKVL